MGLGKKNKRKEALSVAFTIIGIFFLFLVWFLLSFFLRQGGNFAIPYPHQTIALACSYLFGKDAPATWTAIFWTMLRIFIGFLISFALGCLLGILSGLFDSFSSFMKPFVTVLRAVPTVAVVLTLIAVLMGAKAHAWLSWIPVALTFVVSFPLYYEAFRTGIRSEEDDVKDSLRLEGAERKPLSVVEIYLPDSKDYIFLSLAQSVGLSFKVSVMAEVLTSSSAGKMGIGTLIALSRQIDGGLESIPAYCLIVLILMGFIDFPFWIIKVVKKK